LTNHAVRGDSQHFVEVGPKDLEIKDFEDLKFFELDFLFGKFAMRDFLEDSVELDREDFLIFGGDENAHYAYEMQILHCKTK